MIIAVSPALAPFFPGFSETPKGRVLYQIHLTSEPIPRFAVLQYSSNVYVEDVGKAFDTVLATATGLKDLWTGPSVNKIKRLRKEYLSSEQAKGDAES